MKVVLDTNIILVSISEKSPFHWVIQHLEKEHFTLCVTTDILEEYAEVIEEHMGIEAAELALKAILEIPNLLRIEKYYFWQMVEKDPDDNKFIDCAIAANAKYVVSEDKDLRNLQIDDFFNLKVIRVEKFKEILQL